MNYLLKIGKQLAADLFEILFFRGKIEYVYADWTSLKKRHFFKDALNTFFLTFIGGYDEYSYWSKTR